MLRVLVLHLLPLLPFTLQKLGVFLYLQPLKTNFMYKVL